MDWLASNQRATTCPWSGGLQCSALATDADGLPRARFLRAVIVYGRIVSQHSEFEGNNF